MLTVFPNRFLPGIEDFVRIVEYNVEKWKADGKDGETAYREVMQAVLEEIRKRAAAEIERRDRWIPKGQAKDGKLVLSVGELLNRPRSGVGKRKRRYLLDGVDKNVVYVVRDGDSVLYVGCTHYNAEFRIAGHVNQKSALGLAIKRERPRSNDWSVEMISHPDHASALATEKQLTEQYRPKYCAVYMKAEKLNNECSFASSI